MAKEKKPRKKRRRRKKKYIVGPPIQLHHKVYEPEQGEKLSETVGHLFKGEHSIITSLRRQTRNVSLWFMKCLRDWVEEATALDETGIRSFRDLNTEITNLPEGQSHHCKWCNRGFLVQKNRDNHEPLCRENDGKSTSRVHEGGTHSTSKQKV